MSGMTLKAAVRRMLDGRQVRNSIIVFCAGLLVVIWAGLWMQLKAEREHLIAAAMQQNGNVARLFEEHVIRTLRAADITLLQIKGEYDKYGKRFNLAGYVQDHRIFLDPYNSISIADKNGDQVLASYPMSNPLNFRSSENFQFHSRFDSPELFISKPRRGVTSGKWSMFLSHRLNRKDGAFAGDVVLALDADYFSRFYDQIDLGRDSVVTLIGRDGIVRARQSNQDSVPGQDMSATRLFSAQLPSADHGCFTTGIQLDGVSRILCYRAVKGFPLVVAVGVSEAVALAQFRQRQTVYLWWAGLLTVVIFGFAALAIFQIARQRRIERDLRESEERFQRAITAAAVGIWDWDLAHKHYNLSPQYKALLGVHSEGWKLTIKEFRDRLHPYDRKRALAAIPRHIKEHTLFREEFRLRCGDGSYRWFDVRGQALRDTAGRAAGFSGSVIDITERKKAEETRAQLTAIVESSQDAIVSRARDGTVLTWNNGAERLFGYTAAEMIGANMSLLAPPDRAAEMQRNMTAATHGRELLSYETQRLAKGGRCVNVSISASPILDGAGKVERVAVIFRDIGERLQAGEMRARLAAIVESSTDAIVSRALDGTILSWNVAAERLFGYSASEAIGRPITIILPPDRHADPERNTRLLQRGGHVAPTDVVRLTKDGRLIDVMHSISPIKSEAGEIVGASIFFRDITERKQADAQRQLAASVFDSAAEGIVITDADNKIISVNRAFTEITGYTAAEIIGKSPHFLSSGALGQAFYDEMWSAVKTTGRWQGEIWDQRKNGERYCELLSITAVRNSDGEIIRHCAIFMDITRRKQAEADLVRLNDELETRVAQRTRELERTNQELDAFSYSVSHDLRAPLRSISGFGNFLLKDNFEQLDADGKARLQRILAASERMGRLIDDLLKLARISRQSMSRRKVNLHALATEVVAALSEASPQRRVEVVIAPDLTVEADAGLMRVVLDNLLGNAWKFTGQRADARIEVGSATIDGTRAYFVRDNGAGFDMSYAGKLFTPFQRMHTQQQFEGTGIGLATVRRIIERHQGKIWIESEDNRGTTVYFTVGGAA